MKFDAWKDEPYQSLEDAVPGIQAHFEDYYTEKQMSALFPTFLSLGKRIKRLLATDVKAIWQSLEETSEQEMQLTEFQLVVIYPHW
jgi:hypothetical protein